jgi:hypothetical protein
LVSYVVPDLEEKNNRGREKVEEEEEEKKKLHMNSIPKQKGRHFDQDSYILDRLVWTCG